MCSAASVNLINWLASCTCESHYTRLICPSPTYATHSLVPHGLIIWFADVIQTFRIYMGAYSSSTLLWLIYSWCEVRWWLKHHIWWTLTDMMNLVRGANWDCELSIGKVFALDITYTCESVCRTDNRRNNNLGGRTISRAHMGESPV